jgi:hypothetical protein
MRRQRNATTTVWHNPDIEQHRRPAGVAPASAPSAVSRVGSADDRREADRHRAALEALFAPKKSPAAEADERGATAVKGGGRIVLSAPTAADPAAVERQRLLTRLLVAEGRAAVSKAADELLRGGHAFPPTQDVFLQLLEHRDEALVRTAIEGLRGLLVGEPAKRKTVLESRLRRLEELAEEGATRSAASELRRGVGVGPTRGPGRSA